MIILKVDGVFWWLRKKGMDVDNSPPWTPKKLSCVVLYVCDLCVLEVFWFSFNLLCNFQKLYFSTVLEALSAAFLYSTRERYVELQCFYSHVCNICLLNLSNDIGIWQSTSSIEQQVNLCSIQLVCFMFQMRAQGLRVKTRYTDVHFISM